MEKINGKINNGSSLLTALGNKKSVAGVSDVLDYKILISKMPLEKLYRHGLEEFGVKPNRNINNRDAFERKCISLDPILNVKRKKMRKIIVITMRI